METSCNSLNEEVLESAQSGVDKSSVTVPIYFLENVRYFENSVEA